ncbi:hypothetical protein ABZW30_25270 [Kitasatospora sp. NPDC004669]|uniref:hypothetical protein n=1 Tax=Kitasatospora sp. NPDC004669 TaxID=3154555 RepID=UPI0033BC60BD
MDGRLLVGRGGSMPGFLASLLFDEQDDVAAVTLADTTVGLNLGRVARDLIAITAEHEPRIPEPWRPRTDADPELSALTGPSCWGADAVALHL